MEIVEKECMFYKSQLSFAEAFYGLLYCQHILKVEKEFEKAIS